MAGDDTESGESKNATMSSDWQVRAGFLVVRVASKMGMTQNAYFACGMHKQVEAKEDL